MTKLYTPFFTQAIALCFLISSSTFSIAGEVKTQQGNFVIGEERWDIAIPAFILQNQKDNVPRIFTIQSRECSGGELTISMQMSRGRPGFSGVELLDALDRGGMTGNDDVTIAKSLEYVLRVNRTSRDNDIPNQHLYLYKPLTEPAKRMARVSLDQVLRTFYELGVPCPNESLAAEKLKPFEDQLESSLLKEMRSRGKKLKTSNNDNVRITAWALIMEDIQTAENRLNDVVKKLNAIYPADKSKSLSYNIEAKAAEKSIEYQWNFDDKGFTLESKLIAGKAVLIFNVFEDI